MALCVPAGLGGGTAENALLILDPAKPESLYIGNYYKQARDIPDENVLYLRPDSANFQQFAAYQLDALFATLRNAGTSDHIDYVVVMPGSPFYLSARNNSNERLVSDGCSPVDRFSISGAFTMAYVANEVLDGSLTSQNTNRFYRNSDEARGFDSNTKYASGSPNNGGSARQYFIGAMLGYAGERGNPLEDTLAMIDRAVAADGTRPDGTFYYMKTTDTNRSGPRDGAFQAAVTFIKSRGGNAERLNAVLPEGKQDCLGIMTGWADPAIDSTDMTILSGAFCDHLTSYAATFDTSSQVKLSRWIAKGASGSWGTVEEPCNYAGKFPHARVHVFYFQGMSLGEAAFRSVGYTPFQGLLYGDPLTRPFTYIPTVAVPDAPSEPVSGTITLTPIAATDRENTSILSLDLLIDGVYQATVSPDGAFSIDTTLLSDGRHDVRILAFDNTLVKSVGRWVGAIDVDNLGRRASLEVSADSGELTTAFACDVSSTGAGATEVRLIQNGRVVASAAGDSATFTVYGHTLGAGPAKLQGEVLFGNRTKVRSAPVVVSIAYTSGTPAGLPPVAFDYTKFVRPDGAFVVELPAAWDDSGGKLTFELTQAPTKATVRADQTGAYRLMDPKTGVDCGLDTFQYRIKSPAGDSNIATVTLNVGFCPGDMNCDGSIDFDDIDPFVTALISDGDYRATYPDCVFLNADINNDQSVDFNDIDPFVELLTR